MRFENLINPTTPRVMGRWAVMIINQIGNDLSRGEECLIWDEQRRGVLKQTHLFGCQPTYCMFYDIHNIKKHQ